MKKAQNQTALRDRILQIKKEIDVALKSDKLVKARKLYDELLKLENQSPKNKKKTASK